MAAKAEGLVDEDNWPKSKVPDEIEIGVFGDELQPGPIDGPEEYEVKAIYGVHGFVEEGKIVPYFAVEWNGWGKE